MFDRFSFIGLAFPVVTVTTPVIYRLQPVHRTRRIISSCEAVIAIVIVVVIGAVVVAVPRGLFGLEVHLTL
jgi:hypothetical protein